MQNRLLSALVFFKVKISMKCSSGTPFSTHRQQIVSSSVVVTSMHSSAMMLKRVPYEAMFQEHSQTLLQPFLKCTLRFLQLCQGRFEESLHHNSLTITSLSKLVDVQCTDELEK